MARTGWAETPSLRGVSGLWRSPPRRPADMRLATALLGLLAALPFAAPASAQESDTPPRVALPPAEGEFRPGLGVRLRPDDQRGDQADHAAAKQGAGEQRVRLNEGAARRRCFLPPGVAYRGDAGDRLLDLVEFLEHAGRGHLEPAAVGGFQAFLLQPGDQVLAPVHEVGALQLERGRARRGLPRQERETDSQAGEDGGDEGDHCCDSQVAVSCSTCRR